MGKKLNEICPGNNKLGREVVKRLFIIGKTQRWLAEGCGVTEAHMSQIINGKTRPSSKVSEKMAELLQMDVYKLRELVLKAG